jgi:hypothetical protein
MNRSQGATVRIAGISGAGIDLSWLAGLDVPAGVHVDMADAGDRFDLVVSRGEAHVAVVVDVASGDTIVEENEGAGPDLIALLDSIRRSRSAQGLRSAPPAPDETRSPSPIVFEKVNWPFGGSCER